MAKIFLKLDYQYFRFVLKKCKFLVINFYWLIKV